MEMHEIVLRLTGKINPIGETNEDQRRFDNLQELVDCVRMLLSEIDDVALNVTDKRLSVYKAGNYAHAFLAEISAKHEDKRTDTEVKSS